MVSRLGATVVVVAATFGTSMENWLKQNAKTLKKKDDFHADKLRLVSIVEGDLQFLFRAMMKHRLRAHGRK